MNTPQKHSKAAGVVKISDLIIEPRIREDTEDVREYIETELAVSIKANGLHQPIVVEKLEDGRLRLLAGWCRTQAFLHLGYDEIPYCYKESLDHDEKLIVELEENFQRRSMTWQEEVIAIAKIHKLKLAAAKKDGEKWGTRETGKLLNVSHAPVAEAVNVAKLIALGDEEIMACESLFGVRKVLIKRNEDKGLKRLREITKAEQHKRSFESSLAKVPLKPNEEPITKKNKPAEKETLNIELSKMLFHESCHDWFARREPESVDLVYTDIPYGIDMSDLEDNADIERVIHSHDVEENLEQMPLFLKGAFKVLKDKSYLLFWYDLCHHEKLQQWALDAGFTVQPYPLVWLKSHSCKNKASHCWWTKAIETVMVCRKGTATLKSPQSTNYFTANGQVERKLQANPFAKPFEFSKWLLEPILLPGMTVLDCYAGEGSLVRAVLNLGGRILAVEKDELHFNRLTEHIKNYFRSTLTNFTVNFS